MLNLLDHRVCFSAPARLTTSAWQEHIPFAMFLVDLLRPGLIVELGTQNGDSYCALCQAVKSLGVDCRCYAIDTWHGDAHAGHYGPEVLANLRAHHDPLYGSFSTLVQSAFDDALEHFDDGSIELLHIDGYHTYEAVKHDFASWLPKVSARGVILFHDTNVREGSFGVRRLWDELRRDYLHFEFTHGHGLGVLARSPDVPAPVRQLFHASADEVVSLRGAFFALGHRLAVQAALRRCETMLVEKDAALAAKDAVLAARDAELMQAQALERVHREALVDLKATAGWRILTSCRNLMNAALPPSTRRRRACDRLLFRLYPPGHRSHGSAE